MRARLPVLAPLADPQRREITYLRISLTDRCNYRCTYCMPAAGVELLAKADVLGFEEIARVVRVFAGLGVRRLRLTGGEPTIRKGVCDLVAMLVEVPGIEAVVMTTNGHRLPELAAPLAAAGLREVNVSLDTLDPDRFARLTRRGELARVLCGIEAASRAGLRVKLNAVALRGENDGDVGTLCAYAWERRLVPRFIEHMPMSDGLLYAPERQLGAAEIRTAIEAHFGTPLLAEAPVDGALGPARYWQLGGEATRRVGIISAMTEHFCASCNRVRITAVGDLHACLGYDEATPLLPLLRGGADDAALETAIRAAVAGKRDGHEFTVTGSGAPRKHMIAIGG
jgi:cyclic pyranopterin phosphate synthase